MGQVVDMKTNVIFATSLYNFEVLAKVTHKLLELGRIKGGDNTIISENPKNGKWSLLANINVGIRIQRNQIVGLEKFVKTAIPTLC
jgi:hypothetical protein